MISDLNFANLFRQTPEMVCVLSGPEHRFEFVNQAHIRALGFDATGKTVREAQPESVEVHGILDEVYRTGVTADLREIPVTVTDRVRYFNLTYAARTNSEGAVDGIMILGSEVTDQVLTRRFQENQRRWLESMLNRLPSPTLFIEADSGRVTFRNDAAVRLLSEPAIIDPLIKRIAAGERLREVDVFSAERVFVANSDFIEEDFGQPASGLLILNDVTAQKRVQHMLEESENQLKLALSTSKVGFYDWNIAEDSVVFSPQMLSDWGLGDDGRRLTLADAMAYLHPDDRARTQLLIDKAIKDRRPFQAEYRVIRPGGTMIWVDIRGQVHFDDAGKPIRFFGTSVDISARVESEHGLRALADSMPQVVWTAKPDGNLDYTNLRWTEYSGSSDPARWLDYVHDDDRDRAVEVWGAALHSGNTYEIEFRLLRRRDQSYRRHLVRAKPSRDEAGSIVRWFGTCTDIEDQKLTEDALRDANALAENANAAKTAFLANMSHEIRTPLGAILGFVDLMKNPAVDPESLRNFMSVIDRNSRHLLRIVDDVLDLSKVEAGQMLLETLEISLPNLLADFHSLVEMRAHERKVAFGLRALTPLPTTIQSDPTRINQILINLVDNALKFTERGQVTVEIAYNAPQLCFRITDTGVGISDENQAKLFAAFSQGDASVTRRFGGTGLGLVLTRRLCQMLGGDLRLIESKAGAGSTFEATIHVTTPAAATYVPNDRPLARQPSHHALPKANLAGMRVLVVEDQPDNQTLLRIMLHEEGAVATIVDDGEEGVREALSAAYDVVLMDIQMPRMDGLTATRALVAKGYTVPIVALTAHAMKAEREKALAAGFSGFLSKPIVRDALVRTLRDLTSTGPTVLFVDDDEDLRDMTTELLRGESVRVITVGSAEEALAKVDAIQGNVVVLTDLTLPGMSGEELTKALHARSDRARIRVILASGWDDLAERAKALGAEGFLRKPFDLTAMLSVIGDAKRPTRDAPSSR